jgi:flagellar protein FlgJ
MDITAVSAENLRFSAFVPFTSAGTPSAGTPSAGKGGEFSALLEKAGAAANGSDAPAAETPASAPPPGTGKAVINKQDKLYEQCEALETFLIKNLISGMRKTVQKSGLLDTGFAGQMYEDMLYDEYAKDFSKNANFGFAELAYLELTGQRGKLLTPGLTANDG